MVAMRVLHAFWLPDPAGEPVQSGALRLWCEATPSPPGGRQPRSTRHPLQLPQAQWPALLDALGLAGGPPSPRLLYLPSKAESPLPCPEIAKTLPQPVDCSNAEPMVWEVDTIALERPIKQLSDMHYLVAFGIDDLEPGGDFLFWYWFTQALKQRLLRDQYLPALRYRQPPKPKGKRKLPPPELYAGWQWAAGDDDPLLVWAAERMPAACAAGIQPVGAKAGAAAKTQPAFAPSSLLRHAAEVLLDRLVRQTKWPATALRRLDHTLLAPCVASEAANARWTPVGPWPAAAQEKQRQWLAWRARILGGEQAAAFRLGFRLEEPVAGATGALVTDPTDHGRGAAANDLEDNWRLHFVAIAADDPSHQLPLADYWSASKSERVAHQARLGADFERGLLLNLGLAARMVPMLWGGLDSAEPQSVALTLDAAFSFLTEAAWVLEDAGYRVIVPAWWTPKGRQRVKLRLRPSSSKAAASGSSPSAGHVSLGNLIQYRYELAIGDQTLSAEEWQQLVEAKTPLVRFRGQWVELDRDKMQEMLAFWREHGGETPSMSMQEILQRTALDDAFEVDPDAALATMLERLRDQSRLQPVETPAGLDAQLRDYQQRGLAWLGFLEGLGLNGCLADDMGLGKTMQVIARLVQEREGAEPVAPTLLVAPTSVIGNWRKEVERFAPSLATFLHHGAGREKDAKAFCARAAEHDLVITSYALVRRDQRLLTGIHWHRVVLDEAQNIKNPKADQTRAVLKLPGRHRLALTGTPVENRLTDLWSIFNFINPGYLDTQARFRKRFELPVQRDNNPVQTATLKRLVEPFILRRVKTDKAIIADLPDKLEAIAYCNLSREQAALYESVVRDVEQQLGGEDRHRTPGPDALDADAPETDLQPSGPVPARRQRLQCRSLAQARTAERDAGRGHGRGRQRADLLPVHRDRRTARAHPAPRAPLQHLLPARRHLPDPPRADDRRLPRPGRRAVGVRAVAEGRRRRHHADPGQPRLPLRPLVEPRRRGPGQRPRLPHRPAEDRLRAQIRHLRHPGGAHRRHDPRQKGPGRRHHRQRRVLADATRQRPLQRPHPPQSRGGDGLMAQLMTNLMSGRAKRRARP